MSNEPGVLGRAVAADRNATAAIEISKIARKEASELRQRVTQLEAEVAVLKQLVEQHRMQFMTAFARMASGPTA